VKSNKVSTTKALKIAKMTSGGIYSQCFTCGLLRTVSLN